VRPDAATGSCGDRFTHHDRGLDPQRGPAQRMPSRTGPVTQEATRHLLRSKVASGQAEHPHFASDQRMKFGSPIADLFVFHEDGPAPFTGQLQPVWFV
jgi:hypothetical protein